MSGGQLQKVSTWKFPFSIDLVMSTVDLHPYLAAQYAGAHENTNLGVCILSHGLAIANIVYEDI